MCLNASGNKPTPSRQQASDDGARDTAAWVSGTAAVLKKTTHWVVGRVYDTRRYARRVVVCHKFEQHSSEVQYGQVVLCAFPSASRTFNRSDKEALHTLTLWQP